MVTCFYQTIINHTNLSQILKFPPRYAQTPCLMWEEVRKAFMVIPYALRLVFKYKK